MKKSLAFAYQGIEEDLLSIKRLPGVVDAVKGGVNGTKANPTPSQVRKGEFGFKMAVKVDFASEKTDFRMLLSQIKVMAKEKPITAYYFDLLDGIEVKGNSFQLGYAEQVKVENLCGFFRLPVEA
ncbi:MAG: peptide-methionine (S)-S-oxide reductase [Firmicutes bacterium]|uniref:peptide-methionine (S)-S-oxide reductase n=1 Tax=Candidatus Alloenteromonas pullistercoris TaxID=2840785 RepID=A0A9D9DET4_9FIRM|nr:peptide-methionine (S)-S-oxide reductase [Candidatus Enteromonas pullistercoris]